MIVDTHCHLDLDQFDPDREQVITSAIEAGVERIIIPGIEIETIHKVIQLADQYPQVYFSAGVHPNSAKTWNPSDADFIRELSTHPKMIAIGEIGLDYYWDFAPKSLQKEILLAQLDLARELTLPVILHNRDASTDLVEIITSWVNNLQKENHPLSKTPGVFHSFSANLEIAETVIEHKFFIGITGPVTFKNAPALQQIASSVPIHSLLVETDAPYLSPHPKRGQRNEPAHVRFVVEKLGQLRSVEPQIIAKATTINAFSLFKKLH